MTRRPSALTTTTAYKPGRRPCRGRRTSCAPAATVVASGVVARESPARSCTFTATGPASRNWKCSTASPLAGLGERVRLLRCGDVAPVDDLLDSCCRPQLVVSARAGRVSALPKVPFTLHVRSAPSKYLRRTLALGYRAGGQQQA